MPKCQNGTGWYNPCKEEFRQTLDPAQGIYAPLETNSVLARTIYANLIMTTIKYALIIGLAALAASHSEAAMVDFHFGALTQTGTAAVGNAGDIWNATDDTNGGPLLLKDVTGQPTAISASWTSGDAWAVTRTIYSNTTSTLMDPATNWLMRSFASSYSYSAGPTNLALSLSGLAPKQAYTLVLYGAGDQKNEGTLFTVIGNTTVTGSTSAGDRKISNGPGVAYVVIPVVSSAAGTLKVTTEKNGYCYAILNGFQLAPATMAAVTGTTTTTGSTTTAPTGSGITSTVGSTTTSETPNLVWGVCGHPTWSDYASWIPANVATQMSDLNKVGASYYRVSFEGAEYPSYLNTLCPKAQASGITLLPILPISLIPSDSAQTNYSNNYTIGYNWATYAISKGYALPYWELGNEVENDGLVKIVYDGASANDFPDEVPGGFVAIASGFTGAYQGIKDAYTAGRASGLTTITPKVMIGMCYRHWGLLSKIQAYDNGSLPCDMISWHWYGPNYGPFNQPISDANSVSNGRTPAQCLGDFKSHTNPSQPMDIWITETNRSQSIAGGGLLNGSVASNATPKTSQDWPAEATAIQTCVDSFKDVSSVKGIFVYELYDEPVANSSSVSELAAEGYFGLITGLNGTPKNAFYTFQTEIETSK
jgi:hypothetical protein